MTRTNRECITFTFVFMFKIFFQKKNLCVLGKGRAGIEPATSPTRTENHTSRPTARVPVKVASSEDRTRDLALTKRMLCQLSYRGDRRVGARVEKAAPGTRAAKRICKKNMLDGIRTRNPQIRSLVRYPLRHEHLLERGQGGRNDVTPEQNNKTEKNI